jgi:hypothetical protein
VLSDTSTNKINWDEYIGIIFDNPEAIGDHLFQSLHGYTRTSYTPMPEKSDIIFMNFSMHQYTLSMIFPIFSD